MLSPEKIITSVFNDPLFLRLELILSPECNLSCAYCYMKRHNLKGCSPQMPKEIIDQAIATFRSYRKTPFQIDLFGGEPLLQIDLVRYVLETTKDDPMVALVNIPTNGYVASTYPKEVGELLTTFPKLCLSFSVDGPYTDPYQRKPLEEYSHLRIDYDNLFHLFAEHPQQCGFHPMIYAETTDQLFNTFKFFVDNIKRCGPPDTPVGDVLYLLQVRNGNTWTKERVDWLIDESFRCISYVRERHINPGETKFNFLRGIGKVKRGLTCGLQTQLTVSWDGSLYPCHRLIYPEFRYGHISSLLEVNLEKLLLFYYYHRNNNLICRRCNFDSDKETCMGGCLGAQYEYWGDPFIPIPDVCYMLKRFHKEVENVIVWEQGIPTVRMARRRRHQSS
jgi:radical SAM protein with 4Fe4S-binding SPASM domain